MAGAAVLELPRVGVTRWEMPYDPTRMYLLASDPGTASPPKRNSPVVMVWDVTEKPYELVYFHWVSGNGAYIPWLNSTKYVLEKYNPHLRGIDATGPQKAIDELVFEREGIPIDSVNFARDKTGMLNALKLLFQNHELCFPYIKGLRHQLRAYAIPDKDLVQDIVSAMMVSAYLTRYMPNTISQKKSHKVKTHAMNHRALRSRRLNNRTIGGTNDIDTLALGTCDRAPDGGRSLCAGRSAFRQRSSLGSGGITGAIAVHSGVGLQGESQTKGVRKFQNLNHPTNR